MTQFSDLGLAAPLLAALAAEGHDTPTPIQAQAIPAALAGRDILGIAQTGTGKTAAFILPILNRMLARPLPRAPKACRALVLAPTRELAGQIADVVRTYGRASGMRCVLMVGGMPKPKQAAAIAGGAEFVIATPGRLLDHLHSHTLLLDAVEAFVLDEVDQMLAIGFLPDVQRIATALPRKPQVFFFSATLPDEIAALAGSLTNDPARITVAPAATPAGRVAQSVVFVDASRKRALLSSLLRRPDITRAMVFVRTKASADRVVAGLQKSGIVCAAIHGDKTQPQRDRTLAQFRAGQLRVLVATDVAARGIDIDAVSHVVNFDMPDAPETYVHRIGRTARAGAAGIAVSFCEPAERGLLGAIEALIKSRLPVQQAEALAA